MKHFLRSLLLVQMICVAALTAWSQTKFIDSLQNELSKTTKDSTILFIYTQLGNQYYAYDTVKAYAYLQKGFLLAKNLNWHYALGDYYETKGSLKQLSGDHNAANLYLDSSIYFFKKALAAAHTEKDKFAASLSLATCLGQKADIMANTGRPEDAIPFYLAALEQWKSSNEPRKLEAVGTYCERIATAYYNVKDYKKSLSFDKLALFYRLQGNNEEAIANSYIYVCDDFITLAQWDSCKHYLDLARPIVSQLNNHRLNILYYNKLGSISRQDKDFQTAIGYYEKCVEEATSTKSRFQKLNNQRLLGLCYIGLKQYATARKYLLLALSEAKARNFVKLRSDILQNLVDTEEATNNPQAAFSYLKQVVALRDSFNHENSKKEISEIENKYQAANRAKQIAILNTEKEKQQLLVEKKSNSILLLSGSLLAIASISLLGFFNFKNKQKAATQNEILQTQRIKELELEKQLIGSNALLKGQEEERTRVAKDLHDGLGGILSGVKLSLGAMKGNIILSADNARLFSSALDQLDCSINEMRRVAHNMMPESLLRLGLQYAVEDYCHSLNETKQLVFKTQYYGLENRLEAASEVVVYRIIQELLNNVVKHGSASEVFLQIMRHEHNLNITIEDNGKGFLVNDLGRSEGAGIQNVRSRVDYLKGHVDFQSIAGKGTSILIDCPL